MFFFAEIFLLTDSEFKTYWILFFLFFSLLKMNKPHLGLFFFFLSSFIRRPFFFVFFCSCLLLFMWVCFSTKTHSPRNEKEMNYDNPTLAATPAWAAALRRDFLYSQASWALPFKIEISKGYTPHGTELPTSVHRLQVYRLVHAQGLKAQFNVEPGKTPVWKKKRKKTGQKSQKKI